MITDLTLEVSLKPFHDLSKEGISKVCERIFMQWQPLIKDIDHLSVLFWAADGSEILDYKGNLNDTFEWAKYIGVANTGVYDNIPDLPQEKLSIHHSPRLYRKNPPEYRYSDLKMVVGALRDLCAEKGRKIRVGATFDPGPEFARSSFKYERHQEICLADTLGNGLKSFVCCYSRLNADSTSYAGFPDGIEQGMSFGKFLGRQTKHFCADLGFDFIWLSNGFGFGLETWGVCGSVFNGDSFDGSVCEDIRKKIFHFWSEFRKELPDLPIENRGTNLSTCMDLASDAVPLRDIYKNVPGISAPPNSPWAALNGDFGMELVGWMSHIAELPENTVYPFRFYIHDPWFINSPWLDRYGRKPHDIYLPMAICRIDDHGVVMGPGKINLLSVDNSYGEMPDQVPDEVIPHLKSAIKSAPDAAGPVVWLYPFDEYHDMTFSQKKIDEVFFGDWFMRSAVNSGFQINTVVSADNFEASLKSGACKGNVIVTPTAIIENAKAFELLLDFLKNGGKALFYGAVKDKRLLDLLGLELGESIEGELDVRIGDDVGLIKHNSIYSSGGIDTIQSEKDIEILATASKKEKKRIISIIRSISKGKVGWVRGTNSFSILTNGRYPEMLNRDKYFYPETLMRIVLGELGYVVEFDKYSVEQPDPVIVTNYNANALYLSSYVPNMNTSERLRFPEGAPVFIETETIIENSLSVYHFSKAEHLECRVFVEMQNGAVKCKEFCLSTPEVTRRLEIQGLTDATVRFRPEPGYENSTKVLLNHTCAPFMEGEFLDPVKEVEFAGIVFTYRNISGKILISW